MPSVHVANTGHPVIITVTDITHLMTSNIPSPSGTPTPTAPRLRPQHSGDNSDINGINLSTFRCGLGGSEHEMTGPGNISKTPDLEAQHFHAAKDKQAARLRRSERLDRLIKFLIFFLYITSLLTGIVLLIWAMHDKRTVAQIRTGRRWAVILGGVFLGVDVGVPMLLCLGCWIWDG